MTHDAIHSIISPSEHLVAVLRKHGGRKFTLGNFDGGYAFIFSSTGHVFNAMIVDVKEDYVWVYKYKDFTGSDIKENICIPFHKIDSVSMVEH